MIFDIMSQETICSLSYAEPPNVDMFHYIILPPTSSLKSLKYWAPVMETDTGFLKTVIFLLRAQILPLATNNVVCFH